jgi:hypothetical protein
LPRPPTERLGSSKEQRDGLRPDRGGDRRLERVVDVDLLVRPVAQADVALVARRASSSSRQLSR